MDVSELVPLVDSWVLHLRAERKTDGTIKTYLDGVRPYLAWVGEQGLDPLARDTLRIWSVSLTDAGRAASTVKTRVMGVRHFARWLYDEGEIEANPLRDVKPPKVDQPVIPVLTEAQRAAMIKACAPPPNERTGLPSLRHRRDEAIIRVLSSTGMRASECINLEVGDVDLQTGELTIRRGKGGRGRLGIISPQARVALDRYMRVRRLHRLADAPNLWLGDRGKALAYGGLHWALKQRAEAAGVTEFHPHMFRHTATDEWLAKGGSETGAMANFGWSGPAMLQRYGRANREKRAIEEAKKLNLGDL